MIIPIKTTEEEFYFDLPEEIIEKLDLMEGDKLIWTLNDNGTVVLTKQAKS